MKLVRLPLIPAETLVKLIYPGRLVEMEDLFLATAFQAAPDCFKTQKHVNNSNFRHRAGSEVPWVFSKEHHGPHILLQHNYKTAHGCHYDWEKVIGDIFWRSGVHSYAV